MAAAAIAGGLAANTVTGSQLADGLYGFNSFFYDLIPPSGTPGYIWKSKIEITDTGCTFAKLDVLAAAGHENQLTVNGVAVEGELDDSACPTGR